jgi:hypothetical protein
MITETLLSFGQGCFFIKKAIEYYCFKPNAIIRIGLGRKFIITDSIRLFMKLTVQFS